VFRRRQLTCLVGSVSSKSDTDHCVKMLERHIDHRESSLLPTPQSFGMRLHPVNAATTDVVTKNNVLTFHSRKKYVYIRTPTVSFVFSFPTRLFSFSEKSSTRSLSLVQHETCCSPCCHRCHRASGLRVDC